MRRRAVPVVMYHSVGRQLPDWRWSPTLTVPADTFEDHLHWLARAGYRTVDLESLRAHVDGTETLPERSVVLTFDDGYVDNWTYVVPLLEKYRMRGTVLATTDFVDPRDIVRPNLANAWDGRVAEKDLDVRGFMSWPELRAAGEGGILSVECHARTHTWYPCGPDVVDFHHPGDGCYWLDWNEEPEEKPFYLRDPNATRVPLGTPIYQHEKSLETSRYLPPEEESRALAQHVAANGGGRFFNDANWRDALRRVLRDIRSEGVEGSFETPDDRRTRYLGELDGAKKILEDRLGRTIDFFIWPNRAYNNESMALARPRFRAVTVKPEDARGGRNRTGEDPQAIVRMGVPLIPVGGRILAPGGRYLVAYLEEFCGSVLSRGQRMLLKRIYKARATLSL